MRIVHVEDAFYPNAGYQINILPKYQVKQNHEVIIVTSELDKFPSSAAVSFFGRDNITELDKRYEEATGVKIVRRPISAFISERVFHTRGFYKFIDSLNPDIVYAHGDGTISSLCFIMRGSKIPYPVIFDSHMLEMASRNKLKNLYRFFYKLFFTPIIKKNKYVFIRTQDDNYVEKCLGIPISQAPWISVGSDIMLFHPDLNVRNGFREKNGISQKAFTIVYAGKMDDPKGGILLAETIMEKFPSEREIVIMLVGKTSGDYGKKVDELLEKSQNRIIRFPTQNYTELAQFYQASDLSIFPKQCSLSFYDVQACGLPVVSENNNINVGRLKYNNGFTFQSGNTHSFREQILKCINMPREQYEQIGYNASKFVKENYNYEKIALEYTDIIFSEYKRFNKKRDVNKCKKI